MSAPMPKPRCDAWDAGLDEARRWDAYDRLRRAPWQAVSRWIAGEYGIPAPSRSALYRFAARLRRLESAHRLEQALAARDEAGALAAARSDDKTLVGAFTAFAQDLALRGDAKTAKQYMSMAISLADGARRRAEVELRREAQRTRDAQLKLAREKFEAAERRLESAKGVVADAALTDAERVAKMKSIFGMK